MKARKAKPRGHPLITRTALVDPDFGPWGVRTSIDNTRPELWDKAAGDALFAMLDGASPQGRMEQAEAALAGIVGLPEYDGAAECLKLAREAFAEGINEWAAFQRFDAALADCRRALTRARWRLNQRDAARKASNDRASGGTAKAEAQAAALAERDERIAARARGLLVSGTDQRNVAGILAPIFGLSARQIRTILRKAETC